MTMLERAQKLRAEATADAYALIDKYQDSVEHLRKTGQPRDSDERKIVQALVGLVLGDMHLCRVMEKEEAGDDNA